MLICQAYFLIFILYFGLQTTVQQYLFRKERTNTSNKFYPRFCNSEQTTHGTIDNNSLSATNTSGYFLFGLQWRRSRSAHSFLKNFLTKMVKFRLAILHNNPMKLRQNVTRCYAVLCRFWG